MCPSDSNRESSCGFDWLRFLQDDSFFKGQTAKTFETHEARLDDHEGKIKVVCDEMVSMRDHQSKMTVVKGLVIAIASAMMTALAIRFLIPLVFGTAQ